MVHRRWQQGLSWSRLSKCCGHVHHMTGEAIRSSELGGDQTDVDGHAARDAAGAGAGLAKTRPQADPGRVSASTLAGIRVDFGFPWL